MMLLHKEAHNEVKSGGQMDFFVALFSKNSQQQKHKMARYKSLAVF